MTNRPSGTSKSHDPAGPDLADLRQRIDRALAAPLGDTGTKVPMRLIDAYLRGLQRTGAVPEAKKFLSDLSARFPNHAPVRLRLGRVLTTSGDLHAASEIYQDILKRYPHRKKPRMALADLALRRGDTKAALAQLDIVLGHAPEDRGILRKKAAILRAEGRIGEALGILQELAEEHGTPRIRLDLASTLLQSGDPAQSVQISEDVLKVDPENSAALLRLANAKDAAGDTKGALALLRAALENAPSSQQSDTAPAASPDMSPVALRHLELAASTGDAGRVEDASRLVRMAIAQFNDDQLMRTMRIAEKTGQHQLGARAIETAIARDLMSIACASFLLQRIHAMGDDRVTRQVVDKLDTKVPRDKRADLRVMASHMLDGPTDALATARCEFPSPRTEGQAAKVARRALRAGQVRLAVRYLRQCQHHWPEARRFRTLYFDALLLSGDLKAAETLLARIAGADPDFDTGLMTIKLMMEDERPADALRLAQQRKATGMKAPAPEMMLRLHLSLGQFDQAEQTLPDIFDAPNASVSTRAHFKTSHLGALLNEAQLYRVAAGFSGNEPPQARKLDRTLAEDFFFPARRLLQDWCANSAPSEQPAPGQGDTDVPRQIIQYWDKPTPPHAVGQIMESWRQADGYVHRMFERKTAISYLHDVFGPDHVRAFRLANNPAEESDFLRLCILWKEGGIYADADDKLLRHPDNLISDRSGMVVFREPMGSLANNILCACAGHPVVEIALAKALSSLLSRDNTSTWSKTGPGLITRAAAVYVSQAPEKEARARLTILPMSTLRQTVYPHVRLSHKSTVKHWNTKKSMTPASLVDALLRDPAQSDRQAASPGNPKPTGRAGK